jgi:FMN-dependent NADH-azoreductase
MTTLLHVNSSPRGADSSSLALATTFLEGLIAQAPETKVDTLDLFDYPLPPFGAASATTKKAVLSGRTPTGGGDRAWSHARTLFDGFASASAYLFNVPMWNAGIPYVLKHWIDVVTQPGWAYGFDRARGYTGLVTGKRAVVVYTSGVWSPGGPPGFGADFHSTFFDDWLRFVGITDVRRIRYAGSDLSTTPEADLARAHEAARAVAATFWG